MPDVSVLDVHLAGRPIATLTLLQGGRTIFAFNEDYVADIDRPTLSLSFKDNLGNLLTAFKPVQRVIPPFFSNVLPEGNLRRYLAERAGVNERREFYLLWLLGQDLPGALSIHSADGEALPPVSSERDDKPKSQLYRFSLAGIQLKFSALKNSGKTGGLTIPSEGVGGSWIIKLPSQQFAGVPENEFAMMTLARMIGIDVPEINLIELNSISQMPDGIGELKGAALAVKRFDRTPSNPIHTEDFAQVFGVFPDRKYERASYANIGMVIGAETGEVGVTEYIRRLVFSVLIGNGDMHLKNWSLVYPDGKSAALSPAYDLLSTIAYIDGEEDAALNFVRTRKMNRFDLDELKRLAGRALLPEKLVVNTAKETVQRFRDSWATEKMNLPQANRVTRAIDAHAQTVPLYHELGRA